MGDNHERREGVSRGWDNARVYEPPRVEVFDRNQLIGLLGPVQMCSGTLPTSVDPGSLKNLRI